MIKTLIIAEIGINHNGKLHTAKKMITLAKQAGADFAKFQLYDTDKLISKNQELMNYQKKNITKKISQYKMLKRCELSNSQILELKTFCRKKKIKFLCTPYSIDKADFLINNGEKIIKISSTDATNLMLIKHILKKKIKVIISTGATNLKEVKKLANKINIKKNQKFITFMHCTSYYPAHAKILNLNTIKYFKDKYKLNLGYSDHSSSKITGALASIMGASIIEKHVTLSKKSWGPDHKASLEFNEFKEYIDNIRYADEAKGSYKKKLSYKEILIKKQMQKSLIYKENIEKGKKIKINVIDCKRPADGISPLDLNKIIGRKLKRKVNKNQKIKLMDFK